MIAKYEQFATLLKSRGHSLTRVRKVVFETLTEKHPLSMGELVSLCAKEADRASVYRTIELFEKLHIITRVHIGWKYKLELSDSFSHHHHHITCRTCGKVVNIQESPEIEKSIMRLTEKAGFLPDAHQLEIWGFCQTCSEA